MSGLLFALLPWRSAAAQPLDVDENGIVDPFTDVVYVSRHLSQLTPVPPSFRVSDPAIPADGEISARIDLLGDALDLDGDDDVEVDTDIVFLSRCLLELPPVPPTVREANPSLPSDAIIRDRCFLLVEPVTTPSPTPTGTPTATPTPVPTDTPTATNTESRPSVTPTPSVTPSATGSLTGTNTPTSTRTVTPTATRVPTPQGIFRDLAVSVQGGVRVALFTLDWLQLLDEASRIATRSVSDDEGPCSDGGEIRASCVGAGGNSIRTLDYDACATLTPHGNRVVRSGRLVQNASDPSFCTATDLDPVRVIIFTFEEYEQSEQTGSGEVLRLEADLSFVQDRAERDGCDGRDMDEMVDGRLTVVCSGSESIACPPRGADVELTATGLRLERRSGGEPCNRFVRAQGRLAVANAASEESYTQDFDGLEVNDTDTAAGGREVSFAGSMASSCLGGVAFSTSPDDPLVFTNGACPVAGRLDLVRPGNGGGGVPAGGSGAVSEPLPATVLATEGVTARSSGPTSAATFQQTLFRAAGGQVYQVVQNGGSGSALGADGVQVTTLVGSFASVAECANSADALSEPQAVVGATADRAFPVDDIVKSPILSGAATPCFNRNAEEGRGRLCLGAGCTADCGCVGGQDCQTFTLAEGESLSENTEIPPASLVAALERPQPPCGDVAGRAAYRFGDAGPTIETSFCGAAPEDGFFLPNGGTVIFVYRTSPFDLFNAGVAGFPVDTNGDSSIAGPGCSRNPKVLNAGVAIQQTAAGPSSSFTVDGGVRFDYDGDQVGDKQLADCLGSVLLECASDPPPTATPDPARPCGANTLTPAIEVTQPGSTSGRDNTSGGASCGWGGGNFGPDAVFEYVPPEPGIYDVSVTGIDFDPYLYVRDDSCEVGKAELGCNDDGGQQGGSAVELTLQAGKRIAIIVDGADTAGGSFSLDVALRRPDLTILSGNVDVPARATVGEEIAFAATVDNLGAGAAAEFEIEVQFDGGTLATFSCPGIARHSSRDCGPVRLVVPLDGTESSAFRVIVDPANVLRNESDEDNNATGPIPIQVRPVLSFVNAVRMPDLQGVAYLAVSPDGLHLYAASPERNAVSVFERIADNSSLRFLASHRQGENGVDGLTGVRSLAVSPDGRFVYAGVDVFSRDEDSGALTHLPTLTGPGGRSLAISPDPAGKNLYATLTEGVRAFSRDEASGALIEVETETGGELCSSCLGGGRAITISLDGQHVYVANACDHSVSVLARDPQSGALDFRSVERDGEDGVDGLEFASSVVVVSTPEVSNVYATGSYEDSTVGFLRNPSLGELTPLDIEAVQGLDFANALAASLDGSRIFVGAANDDAVTAFRRDLQTGTLSFVETTADGTRGVDGLDFVQSLVMSPDGRFLYAGGSDDGAIAVFRVNE